MDFITDTMSKKPRAKHIPLEPRMKLDIIKIPELKHYSKCITNTEIWKCNGSYKKEVDETKIKLLEKDIFGHFAKMDNYMFSGVIMHYVLFRKVTHKECDEDQLSFEFDDQLVWLSISEWCLVTWIYYGMRYNKIK